MTQEDESAQLWDLWRTNFVARNEAVGPELTRLVEERNRIRQRLIELKELGPAFNEIPYSEERRQAIARGQYSRREKEKWEKREKEKREKAQV